MQRGFVRSNSPPLAYTRVTAVLSPGTIVGDKYRLEEPIGQGGMATVWRAVHTTLDRPVAVKFLEAVGTGAEQLAERFLQEAKTAAGLRHRHVVDILDFGVTPDGAPFMVMELLEGQSLADRYTDGPTVTDWELLEVVAMTLSGLAAVHDAGILHRDVKPENVFLVQDADGIFPKLLDFGISRGFGAGGRITRTGMVVGTPQYMSPEQARGKKDLDARSDLWSVGVVLYEGFTGEVPFDSENPGDVLISVATEDPQPLEELRPDLPESVLDLVRRALQKDPAGRFQNAREMREALMDVLQGAEHMGGRPPSTVIRSSYTSTQGTGKLRALSVPPAAPDAASLDPVSADLTPTPPAGVLPPVPRQSLEPERLPPQRVAPKSSGRSWWMALVVALALVGGGAYAAYSAGLIPLPSRDGSPEARAGAVRPGEEVPLAAQPAPEPEEPTIEPPPTDGVAAPPTETVDIPSPPNPPDRVPEQGLADAGVADVDAGAVVDAGAAEEPPTRRTRRRRRRRR